MISQKPLLTDSPHMSYAEIHDPERMADAQALLLHSRNSEKTSSKFCHGGPRVNSGGARPNCGGPQPGSGRPRKVAAVAAALLMGQRWCVIEAMPGLFDRAVESVKARGFSVCAPMQPVKRKARVKPGEPERLEVIYKPKFYRYFFALFDLDGYDWASIRPSQEAGVSRLILTASLRPIPVRRGLVEELVAEEERRNAAPPRQLPACDPGLFVPIVRGPFAGQIVEVIECDGFTTTVWLNAFGGMTKTRLARLDVTAE